MIIIKKKKRNKQGMVRWIRFPSSGVEMKLGWLCFHKSQSLGAEWNEKEAKMYGFSLFLLTWVNSLPKRVDGIVLFLPRYCSPHSYFAITLDCFLWTQELGSSSVGVWNSPLDQEFGRCFSEASVCHSTGTFRVLLTMGLSLPLLRSGPASRY